MLELIVGAFRAISFFGAWGVVNDAVEGTIDAGSSAKNWLDEQEVNRLATVFANISSNRRLPDLSASHDQAVQKSVPGICNLSWLEVADKFCVKPEDSTFSWHKHDPVDGGHGWIGFKQEENIIHLHQQFSLSDKAAVTSGFLANDYWFVFKAIAARNRNDSSPCMLTYSVEVWKPKGIGELFFGTSNDKLEDAAEVFLSDVISEIRSEFEIVETPKTIAAEIEALVKLRDSGHLSEEEFQAAKRKIIE